MIVNQNVRKVSDSRASGSQSARFVAVVMNFAAPEITGGASECWRNTISFFVFRKRLHLHVQVVQRSPRPPEATPAAVVVVQ